MTAKRLFAGERLRAIRARTPATTIEVLTPDFLRKAGAVETVVAKQEINILIPALRERGAEGIVEMPISKIVH